MGKTDYGVICVIQSLYSIDLQFFQKLMHMLLFWILAQLNSIVIRTERKGVQFPAAWIFDSRFLLHLCPLAKSVITSALTVHCRRERGGEGENCLHKHGYMRASHFIASVNSYATAYSATPIKDVSIIEYSESAIRAFGKLCSCTDLLDSFM